MEAHRAPPVRRRQAFPTESTQLTGNVPNPSNPATTIHYMLSAPVAIDIVAASGVYFCRLVVDGVPVDARRMVMVQ